MSPRQILAPILLILGMSPVAVTAAELKSPDGRLIVSITLENHDGFSQAPYYRIAWNGQQVLAPSRVGLELKHTPLLVGFKVVGLDATSHDSTWSPVVGERSTVRDHYNQLVIRLEQITSPHLQLHLIFRAYNSGAAFCYTIPDHANFEQVEIQAEHSEFRFHDNATTWAVYKAQGIYQKVSLAEIKSGCERPLPIEVSPRLYVALTEARLVDYARMKFGPLPGKTHSLRSELAGPVRARLPLTTPWRVIMVGENAGALLVNNPLLLNLNPPCAIADTSWIKPGKVLREVTLTTVGGKTCVDYAARRNLQYILFDAGWYGHEYDDNADATTVTVDPKRSPGPLDLPEVIRYAGEKGVGVILYVNQRALSRQLDIILPLYQKWGVKGVKYGFVHVGSQRDTVWLHETIRKAADHRLMVNIHDEYRPTGNQRTYPNLMTAEGINGDESSPTNSNTLTYLFSRLLAGPADNTICYYDSRVEKNASHAYQLAKAICLYSAWQHLFWYDRPAGSPGHLAGAGGAHTRIGDEPELKLFENVPTVWHDTRVIHGRIGEYTVLARRNGEDWFVGAMNSGEARSLPVALDFLSPSRTYIARIYSDDPSVNTQTKVRIDIRMVGASTVLECRMSAQGGQAIHLTPTRE